MSHPIWGGRVQIMASEKLPARSEGDNTEEPNSEESCRLPEEARRYMTRLILSRRMQQLREEFGPADPPHQESDGT